MLKIYINRFIFILTKYVSGCQKQLYLVFSIFFLVIFLFLCLSTGMEGIFYIHRFHQNLNEKEMPISVKEGLYFSAAPLSLGSFWKQYFSIFVTLDYCLFRHSFNSTCIHSFMLSTVLKKVETVINNNNDVIIMFVLICSSVWW